MAVFRTLVQEGRTHHKQLYRKFEALDVFPSIPYDMIDIERHVKGYKFGTRCLDYYISQGCASGCSFCSEPVFCHRRWSGLLPEKVVMELEHLAKTYNIDTFMIRDSDFFLNVKRVTPLSNIDKMRLKTASHTC